MNNTFKNFEVLQKTSEKQLLQLTLSLRRRGGGGVVATPPFGFSPRAIFVFLLRLPYGQFTHPLSRYPNFSKLFAVKKVGGLQQPPRLEREGVAAKLNKFS